MFRTAAFYPVMVGVIAGATEIHGENTTVALGLFIAGVVGSVVLAWRIRGDRDAIMSRLEHIEAAQRQQMRLLKSRPCFNEDVCAFMDPPPNVDYED
jgi:membrane protein implicated in regulation of membrane protease activity